MKKRFIFFLIVIVASFIVSTASGRSTVDDNRPSMKVEVGPACLNKDVTVKVTNERGDLMEEVDIDVIIRNKKVAYGKTNAEGTFIFRAKEFGASQLTAKKSDYKDAVVQVNVSNCVVSTVPTTEAPTTTQATSTIRQTTTLRTTPSTTYYVTTTTLFSCNTNRICDSGENYNNCPNDCPSGGLDGLCDRAWDGICDPDCYRKDDNDCLCNNNTFCEPQFENFGNCLPDCPSGVRDGVCDGITDSICDQDCPKGDGDTDCKKVDYSTMVIPIIIILILFGAFAAFNMKREAARHTVEKSREDLVEDIKRRLRDGEDPVVIKKELASAGQDASLLEKAEKTIWE
jgi:hypothetical protein